MRSDRQVWTMAAAAGLIVGVLITSTAIAKTRDLSGVSDSAAFQSNEAGPQVADVAAYRNPGYSVEEVQRVDGVGSLSIAHGPDGQECLMAKTSVGITNDCRSQDLQEPYISFYSDDPMRGPVFYSGWATDDVVSVVVGASPVKVNSDGSFFGQLDGRAWTAAFTFSDGSMQKFDHGPDPVEAEILTNGEGG